MTLPIISDAILRGILSQMLSLNSKMEKLVMADGGPSIASLKDEVSRLSVRVAALIVTVNAATPEKPLPASKRKKKPEEI
jgi:hypothetical protein